MAWTPYDNIWGVLPPECSNGEQIWLASVPLICIFIAEWHQPDRCLRQFHFPPLVPGRPRILDRLHIVDLRNNAQIWEDELAAYLEEWNNRENNVPNIQQLIENYVVEPNLYHSYYMEWYRSITRRWMTQSGALASVMVSCTFNVIYESSFTKIIQPNIFFYRRMGRN